MAIKSADLGKITSIIKKVKVNYIDAKEEPSAEVKNIDQEDKGVPDIELILNLPRPKSAYDIAADEGFVGTQAEFVQTLSLAEEERENVVSLYAGSFSYNEKFNTARPNFDGAQPYGYDFGNGLFCDVLNTKNATLVWNGNSDKVEDAETGQITWISCFFSNGNSGGVFKLSVPRSVKLTIKAASFNGIRNLTVTHEDSNTFLTINNDNTVLQLPNDHKMYTATIIDNRNEPHDLFVNVIGGDGVRFYELKWESLPTIEFQSAFNKFKQLNKNILSLEGNFNKSIFEDLVAVADNQPYEFTLDLQKSTGLNMWDIAISENGIIDKNLKNCKNLISLITPNGNIIYNK